MKKVENIRNGEVWIEVHPREWQKYYLAYLADPGKVPCPQIKGHKIFKRPQDYGCRFI